MPYINKIIIIQIYNFNKFRNLKEYKYIKTKFKIRNHIFKILIIIIIIEFCFDNILMSNFIFFCVNFVFTYYSLGFVNYLFIYYHCVIIIIFLITALPFIFLIIIYKFSMYLFILLFIYNIIKFW